jgi:hypothetical protein
MFKLIIIIVGIFGAADFASAQSQFKCEGDRHLIASAFHSKLKSCQSGKERVLNSALDPVSGVFISCIPGVTSTACLNLADAIASAKTGAAINLLASPYMASNPPDLQAIQKIVAGHPGERINIIPVGDSNLQFLRDPFVFENDSGVPKFLMLPAPREPKSAKILSMAMDFCGMAPSEGQFPVGVLAAPGVDEGQSWGGNMLILPDGQVALGRIPSRGAVDPGLLGYLSSIARTIELQIPESEVGHIDEFFNFAPNPKPLKGECLFALVRASFSEAIGYLKRNPNLPIGGSGGEEWQTGQMRINTATDVILENLKKSFPGCKPRVVDLPIFIRDKSSLIPNPVNGIHINGHYFLSKQTIRFGREHQNLNVAPLERYISQKLSPLYPGGVHFVDTPEFDTAGGNIHCATQNISFSCEP